MNLRKSFANKPSRNQNSWRASNSKELVYYASAVCERKTLILDSGSARSEKLLILAYLCLSPACSCTLRIYWENCSRFWPESRSLSHSSAFASMSVPGFSVLTFLLFFFFAFFSIVEQLRLPSFLGGKRVVGILTWTLWGKRIILALDWLRHLRRGVRVVFHFFSSLFALVTMFEHIHLLSRAVKIFLAKNFPERVVASTLLVLVDWVSGSTAAAFLPYRPVECI